MAVHSLQKGQISRARSPRVHDIQRYSAPIKGIDSRVSLTEGSELNCVYTFNLVPFEYGMAVRKGYREWQIDVDTGIGSGIHTILPFDGIEEQGAGDKLFAITNEGIWDVTIPNAAPILKIAFADPQPQSGYGVFCHYVGDNEEDVLFYADNINGLFEYDAQADTWAVGPTFTADPPDDPPITSDIRFIMIHKERLWFFEESSTKAWYLEVGAKAGKATPFFFGSKFRHGGSLEGLFNWSVDSGNGLDDFLVAVSHAGDVLTYQGNNPDTVEDWQLRGTYYIGELVQGPFFGSEHGGELYLLSTFGLTSMNDLLQGVDTAVLGEGGMQHSISGKITGLLRLHIQATINDFGWQVQTIPSEGGLLISGPRQGSSPFVQYFYNLSTSSWGLWRDTPIECFNSWNGSVVFGDADNRILYMDVTADNILLTPPDDKINGDPISFSILSSYQTLGKKGGTYKRVHLIRPDFLAKGPPSYTCVARFDYDVSEAQIPITTPISGDGVWDVGLWDLAVWSAGTSENFNSLQGTWGTGRYVAIAMRGETREETRFIGWDVIFDEGGVMF